MNLCIRAKCLRPNLIGGFFRFSTTAAVVEQNEQVIVDDSDDALAKEAEIEKKRNISRLSPAHYNLVNGRRPFETPQCLAHLTVKYNRKVYGKYGISSGVNPSLCWPTKDEIQEKLEYESVAFPFTIQEMMDSAAQRRKAGLEYMLKRDHEVATRYAKLDQWKKDLQNKIAKKEKEVTTAKAKKERLVDEVRRHFGFTLDPRDERFQEMLAKREKEQKKIERQAKRDAKEKVMIAKLQQKNAEMSDTTKSQ